MSKKTNYLFIGLHIVAWVIFVGLCIEAGALIVNFIFSLFKPEIVHNLYQKLDLSDLYSRSKWSYYCMYSLVAFPHVTPLIKTQPDNYCAGAQK